MCPSTYIPFRTSKFSDGWKRWGCTPKKPQALQHSKVEEFEGVTVANCLELSAAPCYFQEGGWGCCGRGAGLQDGGISTVTAARQTLPWGVSGMCWDQRIETPCLALCAAVQKRRTFRFSKMRRIWERIWRTRRSESVFLFEICEQILLLWQRCCCAVITVSSYCHSPVNDSTCAIQTVSSISVYYLGHHGTHCKHQGWFWSLPYITKETFSGLSLDCKVIKEPVNLLSLLCNSCHLGIAAGTIGLYPQSPPANLAFEKLFLDS